VINPTREPPSWALGKLLAVPVAGRAADSPLSVIVMV
jgi:hypothetical protein